MDIALIIGVIVGMAAMIGSIAFALYVVAGILVIIIIQAF